MNLIPIDHHPSPRKLALFGVLWGLLLAAVGWFVLARTASVPAAGAIWAAALLLAAIGLGAPRPGRIVYLGVAYAALPIALVVSYVALAVVYYLVLTPTGLLMRLLGYDPMNRRFDPDAETYWFPREQEEDINRYFRQF